MIESDLDFFDFDPTYMIADGVRELGMRGAHDVVAHGIVQPKEYLDEWELGPGQIMEGVIALGTSSAKGLTLAYQSDELSGEVTF